MTSVYFSDIQNIGPGHICRISHSVHYDNGSFMGILRIKGVLVVLDNNQELGIWKLYLFALKSPLSREKYSKRIEKFFDFIGLKGKTIEEKSFSFVNKSEIEGNQLVFSNILKFVLYQIDRVNKKEIVGSTVQNYVKSIKLFCEMADINIHWKKITRGLPRGIKFFGLPFRNIFSVFIKIILFFLEGIFYLFINNIISGELVL